MRRRLVGGHVLNGDSDRPMRSLPLLLLLSAASAVHAANVLVAYYSVTNKTKQLASAVADGAREAGATVRLRPIGEISVESDVLTWADAVVIGSPVHYGNPAAAVQSWFESAWEAYWEDPRFQGKLGAVFATGGGLAQGLEHVRARSPEHAAAVRETAPAASETACCAAPSAETDAVPCQHRWWRRCSGFWPPSASSV
eukprot:1458319-Prymnesium_polylepis.1